MVIAVLALSGRQSERFHLRFELFDAADASEIAVQFGGHVAGLQQLLVEIERCGQVLVTLQSVLLMVAVGTEED